MSGIAKFNEKMKKKLSFGDYTLSTETFKAPEPALEPAPVVESATVIEQPRPVIESIPVIESTPLIESIPVVEAPAQPVVRARKIYSLSQDDSYKLQEIFARRLGGSNQTSICEIMSEAIDLLHQHERPTHVPDRG